MRVQHLLRCPCVVAAVIAGSAQFAWGQAPTAPINDLPTPYHLVESWAQMPSGRPLGAAAGIAVDRDGKSIWVVDRCGGGTCVGSTVVPIMKFDAAGHVVRSFGASLFVLPHTINIDPDGNVWVTDTMDKDGKGQQVFKFSTEGRLLMTLGRAGVEGSGPDTFNKPSDVAFGRNGDIFVADGHGGTSNARIVKFSKDGKFITAWGVKGTAPGEFDTPHAIVVDSRGRVLVADRGNSRIQLFDQEGHYLTEWRQFGRPSDLFIDRHDVIYVSDSESNSKVNPGWTRGVRIGSAKDGSVTAFIPDLDPDQEAPGGGEREALTVDAEGNVFIARTGHGGLMKYARVSFTHSASAVPVGQQETHSLLGSGRLLARDFASLATRQPLLALGVGGALAGSFHPIDRTVTEHVSQTQPIENALDAGKTFGGGPIQLGGALGTYIAGVGFGNQRVRTVGSELMQAQIVSGVLTQGIKYGVRRTRPDGSRRSFPSGHTSATFANAATLQREFGWKIGVVAYSAATYVAVSRLSENDHYLSDVVFGAAVGIASSRAVTHTRAGSIAASAFPTHRGGAAAIIWRF